MRAEEIETLLGLIVGVALFCVVTFGVNLFWKRTLGRANGYGFWSASLIAIPFCFVAYGVYEVFFAPECEPLPPGYYSWYHCDPVFDRFSAQFAYFLLLPLFSLCCAIPTTMWFVSREARN